MRTEYNKYSIAENVQNFMVILTTTAYFETPFFVGVNVWGMKEICYYIHIEIWNTNMLLERSLQPGFWSP